MPMPDASAFYERARRHSVSADDNVLVFERSQSLGISEFGLSLLERSARYPMPALPIAPTRKRVFHHMTGEVSLDAAQGRRRPICPGLEAYLRDLPQQGCNRVDGRNAAPRVRTRWICATPSARSAEVGSTRHLSVGW